MTFEPLSKRKTRCKWMYGEAEYLHCPSCRCAPIIRLRLAGRRPLKRPAILAVLAHELAHLRCLRHGRAHAALTREIAEYFRGQGYEVSHNMLVIRAVK